MLAMPSVEEANLTAGELMRPHRIETKMCCELSGQKARGSLSVIAEVSCDGIRLFEWDPETLENRVFLLRELLQRCEEEGLEVASNLPSDCDPLWDPIGAGRVIGVSPVLLERAAATGRAPV